MIEDGIYISGNLENWNSHTIGTTNTVNGRPVYYYKDATNFTAPYGAGQVILANCTGIHVENQSCGDGSVGILVGYSSNTIIENNTCSTNNRYGIFLHRSSDCTIKNNICSANNEDGIGLEDSSNCSITNNRCSVNGDRGISILHSDHCTVTSNTCENNSYYGIRLFGSTSCTLENNACKNNERGLLLGDSSDCSITNNTCSENNDYGIYLFDSNACTISHNTISRNSMGIYLKKSSQDNTAHRNNIYSNTEYGINATDNDGYTINAIHNWWGHKLGPYHPEKNPGGKGDNVTDYVDFAPWSVKKERKKPRIIIWTPSDNVTVKWELEITGCVEIENRTIQKVELRIDMGVWVVVDGTTTWEFVLNTTILGNGWHDISVRAFDGGEYSDEVMVRVLVDNPEEIPRPDFAVESDFIFLELIDKDENLMNLMVRVQNDGEVGGLVEVKIYHNNMSAGSMIHSETMELTEHTFKDVTVLWKPPDGGNITIIVVLENRSAVSEENTTNNQASRRFTLEEGSPEGEGDDETILPVVTPRGFVVIVVVVGISGLLFIITFEPGKYRLFLLFLPLFSRLTKKDIERDIEQLTIRGQIYQHIRENPGTTYSRVVKAVGVGNGTTTYHLNVLESTGFIKSMKEGFHKYFFEADAVFPYQFQPKLSFTQLEILETLKDSGNMAVGQIAAEIDKAVQTASYNIKNLGRKNLVKCHREHQVKICSLTPKGERYLNKHVKR